MIISIEFELNTSRKLFVRWLEEYSALPRKGEIGQEDGSVILLQPMRLRASRGTDGNRLDCLVEAIHQPAKAAVEGVEEGMPYLMGAVLEMQISSVPTTMAGDVCTLVRANSQHEGVVTYYFGLLNAIASDYPECRETIDRQIQSVGGDVLGQHDVPLVAKCRGRPRKPEYDLAWQGLLGGGDYSEVYRQYLDAGGIEDSGRVRNRFKQAMTYRSRLGTKGKIV